MQSSRLPGKIMMSLGGKRVIDHILERTRAAPGIDEVVVATTTAQADDRFAEYLERQSIRYTRGHERDVLDRYAQTARETRAECIVRLTGDDPLKDPAVIGRVVEAFARERGRVDYVSNTIQPTWPEGQDTEVFSRDALERATAEATDAFDREHVTPYFYRNPNLFRCSNVAQKTNLSSVRMTLDTPEDFRFFERVFEALQGTDVMIRLDDVLDLLDARPDIAAINSDVARSAAYE